jgi:hypothetical protein
MPAAHRLLWPILRVLCWMAHHPNGMTLVPMAAALDKALS